MASETKVDAIILDLDEAAVRRAVQTAAVEKLMHSQRDQFECVRLEQDKFRGYRVTFIRVRSA